MAKISNELRDAAHRNFEAISNSRSFLVIWHESMVDDVIPVLQMGLAVYLDKPIILLVPKGRGAIPGNIRAMAVANRRIRSGRSRRPEGRNGAYPRERRDVSYAVGCAARHAAPSAT